MSVHPLGRRNQVVAAAEPRSVARQRDDVDRRVEVRALDAVGELARHLERDPVAAIGAVERDARDAAVALIDHRHRCLHGCSIVRRSIRIASRASAIIIACGMFP
jgi:hypothetical protein